MLDQIKVGKNVVGTNQTLKMIKKDKAQIVYLAQDVDRHIFVEVENLCREHSVTIFYVETMEELGKACGIYRRTATAASLKNND